MTNEAKKQKILEVIAARGWMSVEIYFAEANELRAAGLVKLDVRYSVGGNRKPVWVAA
jgi:hypothetical protein